MESRPVPAPRRRKSTDQVDHLVLSSYENVDPKVRESKAKVESYENVVLDESKFVPRPAPRRKVSGPTSLTEGSKLILEGSSSVEKLPKETDAESNEIMTKKSLKEIKNEIRDKENNIKAEETNDKTLPRSTGAIRKAPQTPQDIEKTRKLEKEKKERRNSSHSTTSGCSGDSSSFKTASPKEILKSLGESISERITTSRKSAVHKVEKSISNSRDKVESWTLEKTKKAQKQLKKLTPVPFMKSSSKKQTGSLDIDNNRRTLPANDELFKDLSFTSPMKSSNLSGVEDLSRLSMYEVPKKQNIDRLPSYDDVVKETNTKLHFKRNNLMTKSLTNRSSISTKFVRNLSENDLREEGNTSTSSIESIPPPQFPAPVFDEAIYGKIKKLQELQDSDDDVVLRSHEDTFDSNRGTFDIDEETQSIKSTLTNDKCESWSYMDQAAMLEEETSSPEPVYANSDAQGEVYEMMSDMKTNLLTPQPLEDAILRPHLEEASSGVDILREFDPLTVEDKRNTLNIIENILNGDTYTNITLLHPIPGQLPMPPERSDSLPVPKELPKPPSKKSKKKNAPELGMIIHQNMRLKADSVENLAEKYVAKVEEKSFNEAGVDLRSPKKQTTQWHVNNLIEESSKFEKSVEIDPINVEIGVDKAEKIRKIMIHNIQSGSCLEEELPTYDEAVQSELFPTNLKESGGFKSKFTNFLKINRRQSMKKPSEVRTLIEMVPRPQISDKYICHSGNLLKLPSGPLEDILKELSPRYVDLREQKLNAYADAHMTQCKEHFPLKFVTSVQCIQNHKFNSESGVELHCFEINVAIPKLSPDRLTVNPNAMLTSNNSGNFKTQKYGYIYGVHRKSERNNWMQKILSCFTDVFPDNYTTEFTRAGWCYVRKSISSEWSGAWLLLCRRRLLFYSVSDKVVENLDLRKARMLSLKDSDETTNNLHIEKGPVMLIDCPPHTLYLIMDSCRETKLWRSIVLDAALFNGPSLKQQQLTKDNVPVIIDKCINFIYAHGSMTEGIYRKVGSTTNVQKLLKLFRQDSFDVQMTRSEYSEHDVSSALKKFMRDLPTPLLATQAMQFISISDMRSEQEKVKAYKELMERLPSIEYQTLKKIIGHLHFIESQKIRNKMSIDNLSMIWGPTLIRNPQLEEVQYSQKECDVIKDLIRFYRDLYPLSTEEVKKEQIMLQVLKKYHEAAENLSDAVKKSGDLRIWITIDPDMPENEEEKSQVCVTLTPLKTVYEVCKELSGKLQIEAFKATLYEVIFDSELKRPMHYNEKVLDTVVRWTSWPEEDRKSNFLVLKPMKFLYEVERAISVLPTLTPTNELRHADRKSKNCKVYTLELMDGKITVLKKEKQGLTKIRDINLSRVTTFIGCESKRDQLRWAITLIENDFKKRSKDSPFAGPIIGFDSYQDQIVWYSSIMHSLYRNDLIPSPEIIIP